MIEIYRDTITDEPELIGNTLFTTKRTEIWAQCPNGDVRVRKYRNSQIVQSFSAAITDPTLRQMATDRGIELTK